MLRPFHRPICWLLLVTTVTSPALLYAQPPSDDASSLPGQQVGQLQHITAASAVAGIAFPRRVLTAPEMAMLPTEVLTAAGIKELGIDPLGVESLLVIMEPPGPGLPGFGAELRFAEPFDLSALPAQFRAGLEEQEHNGRPYWRGNQPGQPSLFLPDDRTLVVATDGVMQQIISGKTDDASSEVRKLLSAPTEPFDLHVAVSVDMVRELVNMQLRQAPPLPEPFNALRQAPDLISSVELRLRLVGKEQSGALVVHAIDESAAEKLAQLVDESMKAGQRMLLAQLANQPGNDDPIQQASQQYVIRMMRDTFAQLRPQREGRTLTIGGTQAQTTQVAMIGVLVALLLPAVQAARAAARRAQSINNMKQIGLAILNYESAFGKFPARASFADDGKPLLSWRVHVLPFLEEKPLYDQFHLDEPWDSEHNKQLIGQMPAVFRSPASTSSPGKTNYLLPVGPGTMFEGQEPLRIRELVDGTSKTFLLVEANDDEAVTWTKPQDWTYDPDNPLRGLGGIQPGGIFLATFVDCSCRAITDSVDKEVLQAFFEYKDGRNVDLP